MNPILEDVKRVFQENGYDVWIGNPSHDFTLFADPNDPEWAYYDYFVIKLRKSSIDGRLLTEMIMFLGQNGYYLDEIHIDNNHLLDMTIREIGK